ncbi:hypothetical protein TNCV_3181871 [Trichonephila clavipes]|nr:hypothetical protein TNCV_3181871 [Trichonephila clavipes]
MHHSSTSKMQRQLFVTGIVRSCGPVGHNTANTKKRRIVGCVQTWFYGGNKEVYEYGNWSYSFIKGVFKVFYGSWRGLKVAVTLLSASQAYSIGWGPRDMVGHFLQKLDNRMRSMWPRVVIH